MVQFSSSCPYITDVFLSIALGTLHLKIRIGERVEEASRSTDCNSPPYRTLIDFQNISTYFPRLKKPDSEITFKKFIKNEISVVDFLQLASTNTKVVMGDCLIVCFKSYYWCKKKGLGKL